MPDLQRSVNLNTTISSVGNPLDESIGGNLTESVDAAVGAVRSFVADKKKSKLEEDLKALGDEVFAARTGKDLEDASKRFKRLKQAKDQGVLTPTMVKIEAEALLKESIDSLPGFGAELRQHAARILGYDPTGSEIRSLLNVTEGKKGVSFADKQKEQAQFISDNLGVDVQDVLKLQAKNLLKSQQAELITQQATIGGAGRRDILNSTIAEADGHVSDLMGELIMSVKEGGIVSPEQTVSEIQARILGHKQLLRDRYNSSGISPDSSELAKDMAQIEEQWEPLLEVARTGNLPNILETQAKAISKAMTIEGFNVMGDIALVNSVGGQSAVDNYFLTLDKYNKPGEFDLLIEENAALARFATTIDDATIVAAKAYKRVMGIDPTFETDPRFVSSEAEDAVNETADRFFYDAARKKGLTEEEKDRRFNYAQNHGQKFRAFGAYAQPGARGAANEQEVQWVTQTYEEEYPALVSRVSASIKAIEDNVNIPGKLNVKVNEAGELSVQYLDPNSSSAPRDINPNNPGFMAKIILGEDTLKDVQRLNSFIKASKNGWSRDFGTNPVTMGEETVSQIFGEVDKVNSSVGNLQKAIEAFENDPSTENLNAIRAIDPDLVAEIEQGAVRPSGGNNNAQ